MSTDLIQPGGGLTKSKLLLANATPDYVSEGKTFYAQDKILKTGTLVERGQYQNAGGIYASDAYYAFQNIPEGIYRKNGASGAPEVRYDRGLTLNFILQSYPINVRWAALAYNSGRLQTDFSVEANEVYLVVAQASARDQNWGYTELVINPAHQKYVFHQEDYTQDQLYMSTSIKVCVFKPTEAGSCYAAGTGLGVQAVAFVGVWKLVP